MVFIGGINLNDNQNNIFGNWIDILSLIIGIQNLIENEQQSRYNDVHSANDAQAEYLLSEINRRFDEQNEKIERLIEIIGEEQWKPKN